MRSQRLPRWLADLVYERTLAEATRYAALGWPMALGTYPVDGAPGGCSCRRVGCRAPGAHPAPPAPTEPVDGDSGPTADAGQIAARLRQDVEANLLLRTGPEFDVLDLPAAAVGARLDGVIPAGPAAVMGGRYLLFVLAGCGRYDLGVLGMRWHREGGYVPAPPSVLPSGHTMIWRRRPEHHLPDPRAVLDALVPGTSRASA